MAGNTLKGSPMSLYKVENLLRQQIETNKHLDSLIDQIVTNKVPEEAIEIFRRLGSELQHPKPSPANSLEFSRYMWNTLTEEELQWLQSKSYTSSRETRRARLQMYPRLKQLLDVEIENSRKQKRLCMALSQDWSGLGSYVRESVTIARYRLLLNLASLLSSVGVSVARDVRDAAIFLIFRTLYLPTA